MRATHSTGCKYSDATALDSTCGFIGMARCAVERWGLLGAAARFLLMKSETKKFLTSGSGGFDRHQIRSLLKSFDRIHASVHCLHSPYQFVLMAKYILELDVQGPIVECGCYKGGSSAKLSILAKMTKRQLVICDSFAGLPRPQNLEEVRLERHGGNSGVIFAEGDYSATLDEVKENIRKYGCIDVCQFVPGFYAYSLGNLNINPACVAIDVDLISSARDCLKYLWPRTVKNGLWFTHEAGLPSYILGVLDPDWWRSTLHETPPVIFGAGSGLSECVTALAYFRKTSINSLLSKSAAN